MFIQQRNSLGWKVRHRPLVTSHVRLTITKPESTPLSCSLADQGIKIRIRKDIRVRKRQIPALTQPLSTDVDGLDSDGDDEDDPDRRPKRQSKRSRIDNSGDAGGSGLGDVGAVQQQLPWPSASISWRAIRRSSQFIIIVRSCTLQTWQGAAISKRHGDECSTSRKFTAWTQCF
jgi:hypothetical protein